MSEEHNFRRTLITAALPYANGGIHLGHLAGVLVPADLYAKFKRLKEEEVLFVSGSDQHGVPVTLRAAKENRSIQELVDHYHQVIRDGLKDFGIEFDIYYKTATELHQQTSQEFFNHLKSNNILERKETEEFFDPEAKQFIADRYIEGTCPNCGYENAYGDQCEKCGISLSPDELINPKSKLSGSTPIKKPTHHWYLPLDKYQNWLETWILKEHTEWKPNVYGQCKSWLDQKLRPRAITRDLNWGVPVPDEEKGKVLYVWFDAPIGYISATKKWAEDHGDDWEKWWKNEQSRLIHFIGKDNIVFHSIIFPTMLHAHGEFVLPDNVPANEFLNLEGDKLSTSRDWAVWLSEYLKDFPDLLDTLRYVLTANMPETKDNDFTWKDFQNRHNNELVGNLGNYINRALLLTYKYFDGQVPQRGECYELENQLLKLIETYPERINQALENFRFREALNLFMEYSRQGNKYLAETEPWKIIKQDKERAATILHINFQLVANIQILSKIFLPNTAQKLQEILNLDEGLLSWKHLGKTDLVEAGHTFNKPGHIFRKVEDEEIQQQLDKLQQRSTQATPAQPKETEEPEEPKEEKNQASFGDFTKLEFLVAEIKAAEPVPKTDKLLKIELNDGQGGRTVVSGIAEYYQPNALIGKKVCLLANLEPRKIRGVESQGMLLMAENKDGSLALISPEQHATPGSIIR